MNKLDFHNQTCVASLKLLGDFHTLRIVDVLQDGELRFCELQRGLDNLNPVTLTDRLKKLESADLVNRYEDDENCVYYSLTTTGREVLPIIDAINTFSAKMSPAS